MISTNEVKQTTRTLSILFIEDNNDLRESVTEILKSFFKQVDSSPNGEYGMDQYLEYYEKNSKYYDIVLSDILMPIMDGVELTKLIYSINPSQPIIILSAFDDSEHLINLINLGIEQFLKKPIDYQELLKVFQNVSKKIVNNSPHAKTQIDKILHLEKNFFYNKENDSLMNHNENVYLTKYEIIFMQLLTTNAGKIYSNEDISQHYSSLGETIDAKNIRKLISKLRKKIPQNSLESIYSIGYKIVPYID